MICRHNFTERESSVATEGYCPICMAAEIERLRRDLAGSFTHDQYHAGCNAIRNERNRAQDEVERLQAWAKDEQQKREAVEEDRLCERQENERLRAVVECAERWYRAHHHGTADETALQEECLLDAIAAYQQTAPRSDK